MPYDTLLTSMFARQFRQAEQRLTMWWAFRPNQSFDVGFAERPPVRQTGEGGGAGVHCLGHPRTCIHRTKQVGNTMSGVNADRRRKHSHGSRRTRRANTKLDNHPGKKTAPARRWGSRPAMRPMMPSMCDALGATEAPPPALMHDYLRCDTHTYTSASPQRCHDKRRNDHRNAKMRAETQYVRASPNGTVTHLEGCGGSSVTRHNMR